MVSSPAANGSHFRKTVNLREWWLIKANDESEGKSLAVAGFTCGTEQAFRGFKSATITKRLDDFTLETADGIIVILQRFINKNRTIENGFSDEVFSHFLFGFPPNWEDCAEKYVKQIVTTGVDSENASDLDVLTNSSENQNEENEYGLKCGNTNTLMETQYPESSLSLKNYLSKLVGDSQDSKQPSNRKGPKKCSLSALHAESSIQQRMLKASRALRNSSDSVKSKENAEDISVNGGSAKRRIIFDTPVESPRTRKSQEKTCVVSPDSFRRSRSGRLLLPTLQFWRNQIPIYDADRNVIGIKEELSSSTGLSPGSKSEPKKQKKRR